jgi:uncharacterized SAM-binding protein YcdF (DUF218 family)
LRSYLVIFGAAVRPDGSPSGTLIRRIEGAISAGRLLKKPCYLPTGGRGSTGYAEAEVMRTMLIKSGIHPEAILVESEARDTLESIILCDAILRGHNDVFEVIPCTSRYHVPRCAALLRLMGWRVRTVIMPGDLGALPLRKLGWYYIKELLAFPYDAAVLLTKRGVAKPWRKWLRDLR